MPFTIFVTETNGDTTTEVFRATRSTVDLPALFQAAMKQPRKRRSDSGKTKTAAAWPSPEPDPLNPLPVMGEKQVTTNQ